MSNVSTSGLRIDLTPENAGPYATHLTVGSTGVAARTGHGRAYGKGFSRQREPGPPARAWTPARLTGNAGLFTASFSSGTNSGVVGGKGTASALREPPGHT